MKINQFTLKSVKVAKKEVVISYMITGDQKIHLDTCKTIPHPDLLNALAVLKPLLISVFEMSEDNNELFTVNGISITEKKDSEFVIIMSSFTVANGMKSAINTPLINIDGADWEAQEELNKQLEKIEEECFEYLFNNKSNQPEIPFEKEQEEEKYDISNTDGELKITDKVRKDKDPDPFE